METINKLRNEKDSISKIIEPSLKQIEKLESQISELTNKLEQEIINQNASLVSEFENAGAEFVFAEIDGDDNHRSITEDDGSLIITVGKVRGCFINNQELTRGEWNKEAREVIKKLKSFGFKWSDLKN